MTSIAAIRSDRICPMNEQLTNGSVDRDCRLLLPGAERGLVTGSFHFLGDPP
jgi:hypothetical protein